MSHIWGAYVDEQEGWISADLSQLSLNWRKVLSALAQGPTNAPQGVAFTQRVVLSTASVKCCIDGLLELDMIHMRRDGFYCLRDPAVAYFVRKHAFPA